MKIVTLLALVLTLSSCSFSDAPKEEVAVHHDDMEFAVDTTDQPVNTELQVDEPVIAESVIPAEHQAPAIEEVSMVPPTEPTFEEFKKPEAIVADSKVEMAVEAPAQIKVEQIDPVPSYGKMEKYTVQKGDTLMMVAFKIYGDYRKWKDIRSWNKDTMKLKEGTELSYQEPEQKFGWAPNGLPYLIKTGDTLQIISFDKYGTKKKWKSIYDNNRPLIKNPNLIFAGFTIYYEPTRDLASEAK